MNVYIYQAAMLCEPCAKVTMAELTPAEDSDSYPQGPYSEGGGESDSPEHCDRCGLFLENPLTTDGYKYVREIMDRTNPMHPSPALLEWADFYSPENCYCSEVTDEDAGECLACYYKNFGRK